MSDILKVRDENGNWATIPSIQGRDGNSAIITEVENNENTYILNIKVGEEGKEGYHNFNTPNLHGQTKIIQESVKYTTEFGKIVGNGSFLFTRPYKDEPLYQVIPDDSSTITVTFTMSNNTYIGATLSGASNTTNTLAIFYCNLPEE